MKCRYYDQCQNEGQHLENKICDVCRLAGREKDPMRRTSVTVQGYVQRSSLVEILQHYNFSRIRSIPGSGGAYYVCFFYAAHRADEVQSLIAEFYDSVKKLEDAIKVGLEKARADRYKLKKETQV